MVLNLPQISGIQQIGIGNISVYDTWEWYRKHLGLNVPVFDEAAEAALMLPYTAGEPRSRHAVLALNLNGGGGAEIWQYTSRVAQPANFDIQCGDLGIYISKYKSLDIEKSYEALKDITLLSDIQNNAAGKKHFYAQDPFGNIIELVEADHWFNTDRFHCGGVYGATIGVSDMDKSLAFYKKVLNYDVVLGDEVGHFDALAGLPGGKGRFRRVIISHSKQRVGPFSQLLGHSELELFQSLDREGTPIFKDRMWGDLGYIHLCFDIVGMNELRDKCAQEGCPFQVDSGDFDMGEAAGHFAYIEDPDGALIEFVETHKLPIMKKLGWYKNLKKKRDPFKPLPKWMLQAMGLNKVSKPVN